MQLAALVLNLYFATSAGQPSAPPSFDPARDPQRDVWAAIDVARSQHKRILLDVGGEWCGWCHLLDRTLAGDPVLSRYLADHFIVVKVNFSPENPNTSFLSCFPPIIGYPHLFVLDHDAKLLHSQNTDVLESGKGYDTKRLLEFFRRWSQR